MQTRATTQLPDQRIPCDGFVLVGGASSRMGRDKARMIVGDKMLFERAMSVMREVCSGSIFLVGRDRQGFVGAETEIGTLLDLQIDRTDLPRAPIAGLYTALVEGTTPWIAVLACDMPFVTADLVKKLANSRSDDLDAVVPMQPDARPQPLCAFYRRRHCLPVVEEMLNAGDLKLQVLLSRVSTKLVEFDEIADLDGSTNFFLNINRPEDHVAALKITTLKQS